MTDISLKANEILNQYNDDIKENTEKLKNGIQQNISTLKSIRSKFSKNFGDLVNELENLPKISEIKSQEEDEISPASMRSNTMWEWEYLDYSKSTSKFEKDGDIYSVTGKSGNLYAYSSVEINDQNLRFSLLFHNTMNFGCGGIGIMSKKDPGFYEGNWTNTGHLLFCLCCSGTWGANALTHKTGKAMQYRIKECEDKRMTIEVDFDKNRFTVIDGNDEEMGYYDLTKNNYKEDLVIIFYSGSSINHSHEIVCE